MRFTYSWHEGHPRTLFRFADLSNLTARTKLSSSWQTRWADYQYMASRLLNNYTAAEVANDQYECANKALVLCCVGMIDNVAAYRTRAVEVARYVADNRLSSLTTSDTRRAGMYCMAWVYDLIYGYPEMTTSSRTAIRAGIVSLGNTLLGTLREDEKLDGHSGGNAAAMMCGAAAIRDENPTTGDAYWNAGLDFFWGATADGKGRIYCERYFCSDGGNGKGSSYAYRGTLYSIRAMHWVSNALQRNTDYGGELLLDGLPYEPWTSEDWITKIGEWWLHLNRGSDDHVTVEDTHRGASPLFGEDPRVSFGYIIAHGGPWRKSMRWLYERMHAVDDLNGPYGAGNCHYAMQDFLLWDPSDSGNSPAQSPEVAGLARSKMFNPPGHYAACLPEWEPRENCTIHISADTRYFQGHTHLKVGGIWITLKNQSVLLNTGLYTGAVYGDTHHGHWLQQSLSSSGTVLVEGLESDDSDEHYTYINGSKATVKHYGGQCWMTIGGYSGTWGPVNAYDLQTAGGGLAWKRADRAELVSDDYMDFVTIDSRRAYLKDYNNYGGSVERVRKMHHKILVIKDVHQWPVLFRVVHVESRLGSMAKKDHWHFARAPSAEGSGLYRGWSSGNTAWCAIQYYRPLEYTYQVVGGGTTDGLGYGAYDFMWPYPGGTNYPPLVSSNDRNNHDLGHYRVEARAAVATTEHWFVCLIVPGWSGDSLPTFEWIEEPNWFGVRFPQSDRTYRIHKTDWQAVRGAQDDQPPQVPSGVTATVVDSGSVQVCSNPNSDDTVKYHYYYRTKP